eukprot:SAG22_NODE_1123_length_5488_cov_53.464465_1_plen_244_part_00
MPVVQPGLRELSYRANYARLHVRGARPSPSPALKTHATAPAHLPATARNRQTIGCETCTGVGSHTTTSLCANPKNGGKHTLPKFAWSMNRNATPDSPQDVYKFNPWRSPGAAPTNDACGMAGGTLPAHAGPGEAVFANSSVASMGDLGSKTLKKGPPGASWAAGSWATVSWGIRYNQCVPRAAAGVCVCVCVCGFCFALFPASLRSDFHSRCAAFRFPWLGFVLLCPAAGAATSTGCARPPPP